MTQPQAYNRETDFTERDGDDTNHAGINTELDAAALSINELRDNLALIQRDDGALKNGIVTAESLAPSAFNAVLASANQASQEAQTAASQATLSATTAIAARDAALAAETSAETAATASLLNANTATAKATEALNSATTATSAAATAQTSASSATASASAAQTSAANAAASADNAEQFSGVTAYATVAAGQAATTTGQFFLVNNGTNPETYTRYQRTAGGSIVVSPLASTAALAAPTGSALVGFQQPARTATTVQEELQNRAAALSMAIGGYRKTLRRGFTHKRLRGSYLGHLATTTLNAAKKTTGSGVDLWEPDGVAGYNAVWIRDMSMCMRDFPEYFRPGQLAAAFNWYRDKCNLVTYEVPDHVAVDGTIFWTPGSTNDWGSRAPTDGNTMLLQIAWLHYCKTGDLTLYNTHKAFLYNLLNVGIPYDATTKCVYVNPAAPFTTWGFIDVVKLTGSVLFGSVLAYIAWLQLADMAFAAGDFVDAQQHIDRAEGIKAGINTHLWAEVGSVGLYKAATGLCSGQLDVWGSCLAVYCGIADEGRALMISKNLAINYKLEVGGKPNLMFEGGIRHVLRNNDFSPGVNVWEAYFTPFTYDQYQNGAYWTTPVAWVSTTLALSSPDLAADLIAKVKKEYNRERYLDSGNVAPAEWWDFALNLGVVKYCTSACAMLQVDAQSFDEIRPSALLTLTPGSAGWNVIPEDTWWKAPFNTVVLDEFGSTVVGGATLFSFITPESGWYRFKGQLRLAGPSVDGAQPVTIREVVLRLVINNTPTNGPLLANTHVVSRPGYSLPFSSGGEVLVYLDAESLVDLRFRTTLDDLEIDQAVVGENFHDYNYLTIEMVR